MMDVMDQRVTKVEEEMIVDIVRQDCQAPRETEEKAEEEDFLAYKVNFFEALFKIKLLRLHFDIQVTEDCQVKEETKELEDVMGWEDMLVYKVRQDNQVFPVSRL